MSQLSIHLLGPFQVTLDSQPVTGLAYDKVRALLAYLAVEAESPHRRERLATLLWPEQPADTARHSLRQALSTLRRAIGDRKANPPFLQIDRETIQINPAAPIWLDVEAVQAHLKASLTHPHADVETCPTCIRHLEEAMALYRGDFLEGLIVGDSVEFEDWVLIHRERLRAQILTALHHITRHYLRRGEYVRAQTYALRQVEMEPYREEGHRHLMRILARSGQRSAALAQYERCCAVLRDELGVEPQPETTTLYKRIRTAVPTHNLPPDSTPFIGRESELAEIATRLADPACRLLTLVGPGGIGKSRLAMQAARRRVNAFLHGVRYVPLAPVGAAEFIVPAIADSLNLSFGGRADPKTQLLDYLRGKELLLVLDNFEHLLDERGLLAEILQNAPSVKLLVTSRERLNLQAEWLFDTPGLSCPVKGAAEMAVALETYSAVQLFIQSAQRIQPGFSPATADHPFIARICQLLQGMPLGLELAAAWVRLFSCQEIAAEIKTDLDFLTTSLGDLPDRHQSLRAVFDHSWRLLSKAERTVVRKLSVFRGPFPREAAQAVAGAKPAILLALVDKSFLSQNRAGRYDIHPLLKQYAAEKLTQNPQEARTTQDDHCRTYARFLNDKFERFQAGQQGEALEAIEAEIDDVRAAWQWAVTQGQYENIEKMIHGLHTFCFNRWRSREGDALFGKAITALEGGVAGPARTEEEANCLLARLLWRQGDLRRLYAWDEKTEALLRRSVALLRSCHNKTELVQSLCPLGIFLHYIGQHTEAIQLLEESVEIGRQMEDQKYLAWSLDYLGHVLNALGKRSRARELLQEGLIIHQKLNDLMGVAFCLNHLGIISYRLEEYVEAKQLFLESEAVFEKLGNLAWVALTINNIGEACRNLGEDETAAQYLRDALQRVIDLPLPMLAGDNLNGLAELLKKQGQYAQAYELAIFVDHYPLVEAENREFNRRLLVELKARLPATVAAEAEARARAWTLDDVAAEVLAEK